MRPYREHTATFNSHAHFSRDRFAKLNLLKFNALRCNNYRGAPAHTGHGYRSHLSYGLH